VGTIKGKEYIIMKNSGLRKSKIWRAIGWTVIIISALVAIFVTISVVV